MFHPQWNTLPSYFGQEQVLQGVSRGDLKIGHDWLGSQGFLYKASLLEHFLRLPVLWGRGRVWGPTRGLWGGQGRPGPER